MITISGYQLLREIYASSRTLVYRGQRESDQKPVIIKIMRDNYPNFHQIIQFRNQYTITKHLNLPGVIQPYIIEQYGKALALVMEDFGGISLKDYTVNNLLNLSEFLTIAIQITTILEELHKRRIIHKDIKPANLLINPQTKQIKITDFSISSLLPKENQVMMSPNILEGTLAYLSPEQTGRMNRGIDYRSDFYSLGVTFYELLTGRLPFTNTDPMELVHSHIAKQPPSINRPEIPPIVSDIVMKLMAKMAEDRYQSAWGLKHDLKLCYDQWQNTGNIAYFPLAKRDISDRFIIPEKLYDRKKEVQTLLAAFDRVSKGKAEIMLVAGYSGIGKTAVVNEVHKPILQQRGYFIKGKFDQFQRNIPFSAFLQAFRDLIGQLLSESEQQVAQWKSKILEAVGENGQVIIDVIPEVESLIGKQSPVLQLEGNANQNRFNLVFQKFIQVFPNSKHPVVIFLDDLQWADSASLKLIKLLINETNTTYLLLIGAYRDNEIFPAHPLNLTLDEIRKAQAIINTITLNPLSETNLNHLIADTLSCPEKNAINLTQLVYKKTQGNPFFSNQFLKVLHEDGLINFNFNERYWECDIAKVRALSLTDDLVEFMAFQLQKLPDNTQEALKLAACIGNSFDLNTLAIVREKSQTETAADLWTALQEGLIVPTSEVYKFFQQENYNLSVLNDREPDPNSEINTYQLANYKFLHDRVQQAAYFLLNERQKQFNHLKIGKLILKNSTAKKRDEKIFDIVQQLNLGLPLITDPFQKYEIAELNLVAGRKAKASTAYTAAFEYLSVGLSLLPLDSWLHSYELSLALYEEASEVAYLSGNFDKMEELVLVVRENAKVLLDKINVFEVKIQAYVAKNQLRDAIKMALEVLHLLGVSFPDSIANQELLLEEEKIKENLAGKPIEALSNLPIMSDPEKLAAMRILSKVAPAAYFSNPTLFQVIVFKQVNLSIEFGNADLSAYAYVLYGLTLCGVREDVDSGYRFGELAVSLLEKFHAKEIKSRIVHTVNTTIRHWKIHLRQTLPPLLEAYRIGRETGDFEYAGYASHIYCSYSYLSGKELTELDEEIAPINEALSQLKQETALNHNKIFRQAVLNLLSDSEKPWILIGDAYDERNMEAIHRQAGDLNALHYLYCHKLILAYLFGVSWEAVKNAAMAAQYLSGVPGLFIAPVFYFYDSLAQLAVYSDITIDSEKQEILARVAANQEKMQKWADSAPMNHLHKFYLVEAERHRVLGEKLAAIEMYDRAIFAAKENQYINEEALACELAAQFYIEWDKQTIAQAYMLNAYYAYTNWGAKAKVADLQKRYFNLLSPVVEKAKSGFDRHHIFQTFSDRTITKEFHNSGTTVSDALDIYAVTKASQALYGEIHLDKLLAKIMQIVLENGGAEKACLILPKSGHLAIEATAICASVNGENQPQFLLQSIPVYCSIDNPLGIINYVQRTQETVVIDDASKTNCFASDPYIINNQPKSILCTPLLNQGKLTAILYLENNLITGAFTSDRLEIMKVLCSQIAVSLENARLYQESQNYAKQLEEYVKKLEQAQIQIVQSEKMAALGQLMSGISHEINNPVGFIVSNLNHIFEYTQDLLGHLKIYQNNYPNPVSEVTENAANIDLEFLIQDLPQLISSMKEGTDRISHISNSMRIFSRADTACKTVFNIHEGIDSTLLILCHRLKANSNRPEIKVIKNYGALPAVNCYPGQLNQVFMNLLANAIEALEESNQGKSYRQIQNNPNLIVITTEIAGDRNCITIKIADNGVGMTEELQERIFDYLFTTKPVGKGTGMGLSISRQIVEKQHGGKLTCTSVPERGTEFVILIPV